MSLLKGGIVCRRHRFRADEEILLPEAVEAFAGSSSQTVVPRLVDIMQADRQSGESSLSCRLGALPSLALMAQEKVEERERSQQMWRENEKSFCLSWLSPASCEGKHCIMSCDYNCKIKTRRNLLDRNRVGG